MRKPVVDAQTSVSLSIIYLSTASTPQPQKVSPAACIQARNFKFGLNVAITLLYEIQMKKTT